MHYFGIRILKTLLYKNVFGPALGPMWYQLCVTGRRLPIYDKDDLEELLQVFIVYHGGHKISKQ
ncbi:MAG: hypothetical protein ABI688_10900 [Bacteroidota bacterium]